MVQDADSRVSVGTEHDRGGRGGFEHDSRAGHEQARPSEQDAFADHTGASKHEGGQHRREHLSGT